jgi:hypothetical protein
MLSKLLPIGLLYPQNKKFIVKTENIISEKIEHPLAVIYSWISPDGKKKWDFYIEYRVDKKIWRFYNQIVDFQKNKHQVIFPLEDNIQTTADQIFDFVWKKISKI